MSRLISKESLLPIVKNSPLTMLTHTEEQRLPKIRKHRSVSKHEEINVKSPSKKPKSPRKQRTNSNKLSRDEIEYQRFVNGLQREIKVYLDQRLRETRFDPTGHRRSPMRSDQRTRSRSRELNLLTANAQAILTGPSMRVFYSEFIQPPRYPSPRRKRPMEESILWPNEQE